MHPRLLAATAATSHEENHAAMLAGKEALAKGEATLEAVKLLCWRTGDRGAVAVSSSSDASQTELPAHRRGVNHEQAPLTGTSCDGATPKNKRRRIAVTGTGCEGASSQPATDASQPATDACPSAGTSLTLSRAYWLELAEAKRKHPYVTLWGARHGDRWCVPGVGHPPGFLVPVHKFRAEDMVGRYLVKLTWQKDEGWAPLRDETKFLVLSPRPVSAFVGKDRRPYMYGSLALIANDEGMVLMNFDHVSPPAHFEEKACAALDGVSTPSSDEDRFR